VTTLEARFTSEFRNPWYPDNCQRPIQADRAFQEVRLRKKAPHKTRDPHADPDDELVVFYDLTPAGKWMLRLLEGVEQAKGGEKRKGER